jgi:nitrogen fixation/metabolism regulation signal transduction histidine kinase
MGIFLTLVPIFYFINQNYKIFFELAYNYAPHLVKHLEQERSWINTTLIVVVTPLLIGLTYFGLRLSSKIVGPLKIMTYHLRLLSRGQWDAPNIKVRDDDEFQELIESYNYFYSSFQSQIEKDIQSLKKIVVDPSQKESLYSWMSMLREKGAQLNSPVEKFIPETFSNPVESRGSRHVS